MKRLTERFNFLSFNDLLLKIREHLLENSFDIDEVLVDEYQDTNTLQSSLIDTLKPHLYFVLEIMIRVFTLLMGQIL